MLCSLQDKFQWNIQYLDASQSGFLNKTLLADSSAYGIDFQMLRVAEGDSGSFYSWKSLFQKRRMHSELFCDSRFASICEYIVMLRTLAMLILEIQIYLFIFGPCLLHLIAFVFLYIVNLLLLFYLSLLLFFPLFISILFILLHYFFLKLKNFLC